MTQPIRVNPANLGNEADSLRQYVQAMDGALNEFEQFATANLAQWTGLAQEHYSIAKNDWDNRIAALLLSLNGAPGVVEDIANLHLAADRTSAGFFGGR